jgi:hypothetical protein
MTFFNLIKLTFYYPRLQITYPHTTFSLIYSPSENGYRACSTIQILYRRLKCRIQFVYELTTITFEVQLDIKGSTNTALTAKDIQSHLAPH